MVEDQDELFRSLVRSALDFLNKSLDEFETSPKFSTIHFATAIELFLKSRLLKEHWALLIERIDSADRAQFFQGGLKTIGPQTAIKRLSKLAGDPVPEEAVAAFTTLAKHRNRMVHFVHTGIDGSSQVEQQELEAVVAEQCNGWRQLQLLLEKNWAPHFQEFATNIASIESKMQRHRLYLQAKFKSCLPEIEMHQGNQGSVRTCYSCGYDAVLVAHVDGAVSSANCLVCWWRGSVIEIVCGDGCDYEYKFDSYEGPPEHCPSCRVKTSDWLPQILDSGDGVTPDNYMDHLEKNCPHCSGYHTVVEHSDGYICTQCFEYSTLLEACEWCNEGQLGGVPELSMISGCDFCDGRAGWEKD